MKDSPPSAPGLELDFGSENTAPVHPAFVEAIVQANQGFATNFEDERWTRAALADLRAFFEHDELQAYTVSTGTAANAIAIAAMTPAWGTVLCHWDAHIETDECGAPEMFSAGARQIGLPGDHGRLDPGALERHLAQAKFGVVHSLQPSVLSLTNLTEAGTAYKPEQISALAAIAARHGLSVHLDGARFANAVVASGATPAELTWRAGVDIITLGATKSGAFGVESIVSFNPRHREALAFLRKRGGHLAPKSRFLSAQLSAYLRNDVWQSNAVHANAMATRLANGLAALEGARLVHPTEGNEVLIELPEAIVQALVRSGVRFQRDWRLEPRHHRFVCSWATRVEQVDTVIKLAGDSRGEVSR